MPEPNYGLAFGPIPTNSAQLGLNSAKLDDYPCPASLARPDKDNKTARQVRVSGRRADYRANFGRALVWPDLRK